MTSGEEIIKIQLGLLSEYAKVIIGSLEDNNAILKKILDSAQNISWKSNIIADKITEDDTQHPKGIVGGQSVDPLRTGVTIINPYI